MHKKPSLIEISDGEIETPADWVEVLAKHGMDEHSRNLLLEFFDNFNVYSIRDVEHLLERERGKFKEELNSMVKPKAYMDNREDWKDVLLENGLDKRFCSILFQLFDQYNIASIDDITKLLDSNFSEVKGFGYQCRNAVTFLYATYFQLPYITLLRKGIPSKNAIFSILIVNGIPYKKAELWCWDLRMGNSFAYIRSVNIETMRMQAAMRYNDNKENLHREKDAARSYQHDLENCECMEIVQEFIKKL